MAHLYSEERSIVVPMDRASHRRRMNVADRHAERAPLPLHFLVFETALAAAALLVGVILTGCRDPRCAREAASESRSARTMLSTERRFDGNPWPPECPTPDVDPVAAAGCAHPEIAYEFARWAEPALPPGEWVRWVSASDGKRQRPHALMLIQITPTAEGAVLVVKQRRGPEDPEIRVARRVLQHAAWHRVKM